MRPEGIGSRCRRREYDVGNQTIAPGRDRCGAHARVSSQVAFDFAWLDSEATNLHLLIESTKEVQRAVGAASHSITAAVYAVPSALDKTLRGELRAAEVAACQSGSADPQLARNPDWERLRIDRRPPPGHCRSADRLACHFTAMAAPDQRGDDGCLGGSRD